MTQRDLLRNLLRDALAGEARAVLKQIGQCAAGMLCLFSVAAAQAELAVPSGRYTVDATHAYITFSYSHLGFSTPHLGFNEFDVTLDLNALAPAESALTVVINAASIDSRVDEFDEHLRGKEYFHVAQYPKVRFTATQIEMTGENRANITGDLTIKSTTKPLTLETRIVRAAEHPMLKKPVVGISAFADLKRSEWGLGKYVPAVGDTVSLYITAELVHQAVEPAP
ncbi:MAG: YceI family protein [Pseudomonadales bacterium]